MNLAAVGLVGAAACLSAAALEQTAIAAAPASARVLVLDFRSCGAAAAPDVRNLVSVELRRPVALFGEADASGVTAASPAPTVVHVACVELRAQIDVDDPVSGKAFPRMVDLSAAAPVARSHLLALSIVELLAASLLDIQRSSPSKVVANPGDVSSARGAPPDQANSASESERSLRAVAVVATQTSDGNWSRGAGAIIAGDPNPHIGWLAHFGFQRGERSFALGHVTADTASVMMALLAGTSFADTWLRAGLGARGGGAWLNGTPAPSSAAVGGAVRGPWWGPVAVVDGSLVVRRRLVLEVSLEVGRVILPVVASVEGAEPVAIKGNWIGVTFGAGITL